MKAEEGYKGKYAKYNMPYGCLYLNNDGSRWVTNDMRFVLKFADGTQEIRIADYFYSLGNFSGIAYRVKGKRFRGLPKSGDGYETRLPDDNGTLYVFHEGTHISS